jgi:hypothetical protein
MPIAIPLVWRSAPIAYNASLEDHKRFHIGGSTGMTKVFLLAGQSNMVGGGRVEELPGSLCRFPENVRLFEDGAFRPLLWREGFGPEVGFAHGIGKVLPDDLVVLCKVARGGANLYYDWNPDGVSRGEEDQYRGPLYPRLWDEVERLASALGPGERDREFAAMLWMQGERDAVFEVMADAYEENLREFISSLRGEVGVEDLPFLIGQIAPRSYNLGQRTFRHTYRKTVQKAQRAVAAREPEVGLVESIDLPQNDNLHFDTGGQVELGHRFAQAYLSLTSEAVWSPNKRIR